MNRMMVPLTLSLLALSTAGCRDLTSPKAGYLIVPDKDSPVFIKTQDLEGAGFINMFDTAKQWTQLYFNPSGAFTFNQPLPEEAWHCASFFDLLYGTARGCVAALRVGDDKGFFSTARNGRIYVCTEDYEQSGGRRRCGSNTIENRNFYPATEWETRITQEGRPMRDLGDYVRNWQGDGSQRLFSGFHQWDNSNNAWDPAFPTDSSGSWQEFPYAKGTFEESTFLSGDPFFVDLGVSRVFIPWRAEHYVPGSYKLSAIQDALGGLGLAEVFVDRMMDNPISQLTYTQNARRWLNTLTGIWTRGDVSPEVHFRVADNIQGDAQLCMVQYVAANNRINGRPDSWWRFDQGFAALFIQWLGIGDCPTNNVRIQYCGKITQPYSSFSPVEFRIDPTSVKATMEPYSVFRPACNNRFKPQMEANLPELLVGPAEVAVSEGLQQLLGLFNLLIGGEVHRIVMTPTGMYLVTAETFLDPQYGIGDSTPELEEQHYGKIQPAVTLSSVPATGITRPVQ